MSVLLKAIPNGIFLPYFVLGFIGLIYFFREKANRKQCVGLLVLIAIMICWRMVFGISSKRYASALILIFVESTIYIIYKFLTLKKAKKGKYAIIIIIALIAISLFETLKPDPTKNTYYDIVDCLKHLSKKRETTLFVEKKEINRLQYYTHALDNTVLKLFDFMHIHQDEMIDSYKQAIISSAFSDYGFGQVDERFQTKPVCSIISNYKNKKKSYLVSLKEKGSCEPAGNMSNIHFDNNLLTNGNFESVDSKDVSNGKNEAHLRFYKSKIYLEYLTPHNVFYYSNRYNLLQRFELFTTKTIEGNYSLRVNTNFYPAHAVFYQRFNSGSYDIDFYIRGKKDTVFVFYYNVLVNENWIVVPITRLVIPDNRLFHIQKSFSTLEHGSDVIFMLGFYVINGEIEIDCISLTKESNI